MPAHGEAEFTAFVQERGAALLRTAVLLAGDRAAGQDLLQLALVKTVRHWSRIRPGGAEAYVARVLATTAIDEGRRARWREQSRARLPEAAVEDGRLGQVGDRERLFAALRALPAGQRAVVVLRYYEDLSEAETADRLGVSPGTVKSQASRGLQALRAALDQQEEAR